MTAHSGMGLRGKSSATMAPGNRYPFRPLPHVFQLATPVPRPGRTRIRLTPTNQPRWNFESLDFRSTPPAGGACPAGTVPVYRAYNNGFNRHVDSNHRITVNQAGIAAVVARGWVSEGVVMCAPG